MRRQQRVCRQALARAPHLAAPLALALAAACNPPPKEAHDSAAAPPPTPSFSSASALAPASASASAPAPAPACTKNDDCRLFASYCEEAPCACRALSPRDPSPKCLGGAPPSVKCFADPCMKKAAECQSGACVVTVR